MVQIIDGDLSMMIWFTGDQHFRHANIIKYCNRPFTHADEMDEALIEAWNKVVKLNDIVYHLGDFTLSGRSDAERLFWRLNGNIHMLFNPWHHDRRWLQGWSDCISASGTMVILEHPIVVLEDVEQIDGRGVPAILCHYAFEIWDRRHYGALHFHGHSHGELPQVHNRLDIGIDNAFKLIGKYRPLLLEEAINFAYQIP